MRAERGFTIIELMIVVTIIGVLAALAIPMYQNYVNRAKVGEAPLVVAPVIAAVVDKYTMEGAFPADNAAANLGAPDTLRGRYVSSIEIQANGVIFLSFDDKALAGQTITYTPAVDSNGKITWSCTTTLPSNLIPKGCD